MNETLEKARRHSIAAKRWEHIALRRFEQTGQEADVRPAWDMIAFHRERADALFYQVERSLYIADYLRARGYRPTI